MVDGTTGCDGTRNGAPGCAAVDLSDRGLLLDAGERSRVAEWACLAMSELGLDGEVRVRLVGDGEMSAAHVRFAGVAGATDVLTFDLRDEGAKASHPRAMDVDIYACVDEARRQAAARGHEVERELVLYVVHGVLHCLGYDDHDEGGHREMHAAEDRVLEAIGVGAVYGREDDRAEGRA